MLYLCMFVRTSYLPHHRSNSRTWHIHSITLRHNNAILRLNLTSSSSPVQWSVCTQWVRGTWPAKLLHWLQAQAKKIYTHHLFTHTHNRRWAHQSCFFSSLSVFRLYLPATVPHKIEHMANQPSTTQASYIKQYNIFSVSVILKKDAKNLTKPAERKE